MRHEFLCALEHSGCVGDGTGWHPHHLTIYQNGELQAILPGYIKMHSYGEYVFDWSWAQAYERNGMHYYPKLVCAVPFSPVPGPRLLCQRGADTTALLDIAISAVKAQCHELGLSSWHLLFPDDVTQILLTKSELLQRSDIQFHWHNQDYPDFEAFLAGMRSAKRKQIRRERRIVADQGVRFDRYSGASLDESVINHFYSCYRATYLKRSGHQGYLNLDFFQQLALQIPKQMLILIARIGARPVAAALLLFDQDTLYGRYWGATEEMDCLHFETCYYQGIDFCIEHKLRHFNPGTQGEHKLVRGFEPTATHSYHWIKSDTFRPAIARFLAQEGKQREDYQRAAEIHLPFRRDGS